MRLHQKLLLTVACLLLPTWLTATEAPLRIVTLHPILTEFALAIGGEATRVEGLIPGGVDPHTFEPTPKQVVSARSADLVLATGLHLEGFLDRLATGDGQAERVLRVGEHLPIVITNDPSHAAACTVCGSGESDPHWWHSIGNALFVTDLIRAQLTHLRPTAADAFAHRTQLLQQTLFSLQAWAGAQIRSLPAERRHLFTTHDAFSYLARDFGFTVHPLAGLSTESEPDAQRLSALVDTVRRLGVKAVFAEDSASSRLIQTLARETGVTVPPSLYADGPGALGSNVETYEAMYRFNLTTIVNALK